MAARDITITLRFDMTSKEMEEAMLICAKMNAKHLLTQAALVSGARQPEVVLTYGDLFATSEQINVIDVEDIE